MSWTSHHVWLVICSYIYVPVIKFLVRNILSSQLECQCLLLLILVQSLHVTHLLVAHHFLFFFLVSCGLSTSLTILLVLSYILHPACILFSLYLNLLLVFLVFPVFSFLLLHFHHFLNIISAAILGIRANAEQQFWLLVLYLKNRVPNSCSGGYMPGSFPLKESILLISQSVFTSTCFFYHLTAVFQLT